jgi:hypothetical protein
MTGMTAFEIVGALSGAFISGWALGISLRIFKRFMEIAGIRH